MKRREFLQIAGVSGLGLMLGCTSSGDKVQIANAEDVELSHFVFIDTNGVVTILNHKPELGQGVYQAIPMIIAEELGITSENVDAQLSSNVPEVLRLLGAEGSYGEMLELAPDWAYQIIKHIGNYSESYEANVGPNTPLEIARGLNALWTQGGILYAPPFR